MSPEISQAHHFHPPKPAVSSPVAGRPLGRRGFLRRAAFAGAGTAVGALTAACSRVSLAADKDGGNLLERLRSQGGVRLGIAGEIPYAYIDKQGKLTGEAPTVAKTIFRRLGVERTTPVPTDFGSLIPGLKVGLFDVIAAGMFITPERCAEVLFSDPDYQVKEALVVRKGNPKGLRDYSDVARTGAVVGVASGGIEINYAKGSGVASNRIKIYPDQLSVLEGLEAGRMDAVAGTSLTLRNLLEDGSHRKVQLAEPFIPVIAGEEQRGAGGYAFHTGQKRLCDAFNEELHKLRASGELLRLVRPYGFAEDEMTTFTAKELCGHG